ncbi:MAG TPA: methyl-accepting chemotaxis protein [Ignavibacteriaceae bacterium]|nr:methyl-accepting chemotaxis protein [Ignavibacteriaceae bacterium]
MKWFKNLRFVRKIQGGFFALSIILGLVILASYILLNKMSLLQGEIFHDYVTPQSQIEEIYSQFQKTQFIMMQFSMKEFADKFNDNVKEYEKYKKSIDSYIDSLLNSNLSSELKDELTKVKQSWTEYKTIVVDAILSASVTHNYEMAADIAITSGEEIGMKLNNAFNSIRVELHNKSMELDEYSNSALHSGVLLTVAGALLGAAIFLISVLYIAPTISKPIENLKGVVKEFSLGNYEVEIENDTKDEIGELTLLFNELKQAQKEKIVSAEQIASGKIEKVKIASDKDSLAIAFNKEADIIKNILDEAHKLIVENKKGNLNYRADSAKFAGSWKQLIEGINSVGDAILAPIKESAEILEELANGNLTARVRGDYSGDHELIKNSINTVAQSLSKAISEVSEAVMAASAASNQISASAEEMSAGAKNQTAKTSEVSSSIEEMTATILENTKNASLASDAAMKAGDKAKEGGKVVEGTIQGMNRIADVVKKSAKTVEALGKSSNQIGQIVEVINEIAEQTNLLALNAAIEAARAGEQGRGFAVVADEVKKLAERTSKATKEIGGMIKQIQSDTGEAVQSMKLGTEEVDKGKASTDKAGKVLNEIITEAGKVIDIAALVASASEQQSKEAETINQNIESINNVTQQSAVGIEQVSQSAASLYKITQKLELLIKQFKLSSGEHSRNYKNKSEFEKIS